MADVIMGFALGALTMGALTLGALALWPYPDE